LNVSNLPNSFDVLILCDVFEHLQAPTATLHHLRPLLREHGGWLLLITGNADAPACRRHPASFWYFRTPQHLCMLNRRHADFLSATLQLQLIAWRPLCHYHISWPLKLRAAIRDFAYRHYHRGSSALLRSLIGRAPILRRVRNWPAPPDYNTTRDHVLAIFRT
jgi:SAM-dependent methyltransferase